MNQTSPFDTGASPIFAEPSGENLIQRSDEAAGVQDASIFAMNELLRQFFLLLNELFRDPQQPYR